MENYIKLMRPKHWVKNLLIFLPSALASEFEKLISVKCILAFLAMSFIASAVYILNDIKDVEKDRLHPQKKYRPIAAGDISVKNAFQLSTILVFLSFAVASTINTITIVVIAIYFILNMFYSNIIKQIKFLDVLILSCFYILRLYLGSIVNNTTLTGWFIATMSMAFLTLSLNKRYAELKIMQNTIDSVRAYNIQDTNLLAIAMINTAFATLIFLNIHASFILNIDNPLFYGFLNLLLVFIILLYFDDTKNKSDDPIQRITTNPLLILSLVIIIAMYLFELQIHSLVSK